jgi:hypothetical protein
VQNVTSSDEAVSVISLRLKQLQHAAFNLHAEPTVDGLVTAFQQLSHIQQQLQQAARACKVEIYRAQRDARIKAAAAAAARGAGPGGAAEVAAAAVLKQTDNAARVQMAAYSQLRVAADDAQGFLLSLMQQLLQVLQSVELVLCLDLLHDRRSSVNSPPDACQKWSVSGTVHAA